MIEINTVGFNREDSCWAGWRRWSADSFSVFVCSKSLPVKITINNEDLTNARGIFPTGHLCVSAASQQLSEKDGISHT